MANELQIFNSPEFGTVRTTEIDGKTYFMASDIAKALGYSNPNKAVNDHCKAITKCSTPISGKMQAVNFIPEGDVYRLIVNSKLPSAEKFERWVFDEVLPSIRRDGGYIQTTPTMSNEEIIARAVLLGQKTIEELTKQIEEIKPKRIFADAVTASPSSILVGDLAKLLKQNGIDIGQQRLFEWLRRYGYVIKYGRSRNIPTQYSMDLGLMEIEEKVVRKDNDRYIVNKLTKIITKGQQYFINKFLQEQQIS